MATWCGRKLSVLLVLTGVLIFSPFQYLMAQVSSTGQTGLINMPDARIAAEGTLRFGASYNDPYTTLWSSIAFFSRVELSARYTIIDDAPAFQNNPDADFGSYKDKAFDAKLMLLRESRFFPEVTVGTQDFTGTQVFEADFITLNKKFFNDFDMTLGYGSDRIDGLFGGLRYNPAWHRNLGLVLEYDAYDYQADISSRETGADKKDGGMTYGLEYKLGWFGTQVSYNSGDVGGNLFVSIPLNRKEYIPKLDEPAPFSRQREQQSLDAWRNDSRYAGVMLRDLEAQGYKNVRVEISHNVIDVSLTHPRIFLMGRAVGRAARTVLLAGPADMDTINITYTRNDLALLTYRFSDLQLLRDYFKGVASDEQLNKSVEIAYASPGYTGRKPGERVTVDDDQHQQEVTTLQTAEDNEGHLLGFKWEDRKLSSLHVVPFNARLFVNDPSGAFHYDIYALAQYRKHFGRGFFLDSGARFTLFEDVSKVKQKSNSELPHVRSDVADYLQGDRLRMDKLLLNKYSLLGERIYSRVSTGYYEEMFGGAGGQLLYLPQTGDWAVDLTVDWLRQRSASDSFAFRDYTVVTALGALHYRLPTLGLTATARAGRFLAKDKGVRFELKRRFRSGVELGAWYTVTDGDDSTPPGSPGDPYYDKGIYMLVYLNAMLTKDTQAFASMSISPWTRDVGQMVASPGDLYNLLERPLMLDSSEISPMTDFGK